MCDSEHENLCPEPAAAAVYGGCGGKPSDPAPPRNFYCSYTECPLTARLAELYGVRISTPKLKVTFGTGEVIPFPTPANEN